MHVMESTATGTLAVVALAANGLVAAGDDVSVIYSRRPETPGNIATLFHPLVSLHELPMRMKSLVGALFKLRRLLFVMQPDIVHFHSSYAGFVGRVALFGRLSNAKLFYSPHCISVMRSDIYIRKFVFALLERLASLRRCTYIACSRSEEEAIKRWIGTDAYVLENAVNLNGQLCLGTQRSVDGRFTVVSVGGVREQKNPLLFAEIAENVCRTTKGFRFVWIGDGDPDLVEILKGAGVEVTGWMSTDQVRNLLSEAHLFLSTSSWEGMPVSVLEAMAAKVPVVVSSCPGNIDVVSKDVSGFIFDSMAEACDLLMELRDDYGQGVSVAQVAYEQVFSRFSSARYVAELGELYDSNAQAPRQRASVL